MPRRPWQTEEWKTRRKEILLIRNKCEWCFRTENLHIAHKKHVEKYTLANPEYLLCRDEDIRVLCARCHLADHKNLTPCPACNGWKWIGNDVCKKCYIRLTSDEVLDGYDEKDENDDDYYDD